MSANGPMQGKRVLVTGPTAGIGKRIALDLAVLGADLILGCRDVARGARAADEIRAATGTKSLEIVTIDTSSQRSIRECAARLRTSLPRLDVLVNNAGISHGERKLTFDGIELTFATNVLGYFLLTQELLPLLRTSAPARIVNVSSLFAGDVELDDLQFARRPYDGLGAYAQSKACNRLLTWALARRIAGSGVTANTYAPGFVAGTELSRDLPPAIKAAYSTRPGRTAEQGADTAVWLASSAEVAGESGRFYMDRREIQCELRDETTEEALWAECERLTR